MLLNVQVFKFFCTPILGKSSSPLMLLQSRRFYAALISPNPRPARRHILKIIVNKISQFFEFIHWILTPYQDFDKFEQDIHLRLSLQAAYGIRGQLV